MQATIFPEANFTFTKPQGWTDDQCSALEVHKGTNADGVPVIISKWIPNEYEVQAILNGEGIYLGIVGEGMPPVWIQAGSPFGMVDESEFIESARKAIVRNGSKGGFITCPKCNGILGFTFASNGHISGQCNTPECLNWRE